MKDVPNHIAIVPDGNRRWSRKHKLTKHEGYAKGIQKIGDVLKWCKEFDVHMLTMWGFSTDNFKRDKDEVDDLFGLFKDNLKKAIDSDDRNKNELRVRFFGRIHLFPKEIQYMIKKAEEVTSTGQRQYQLNLLLSYGGREEIIDAINEILASGTKKVDEEILSNHMYTKGLPDPDLIIRTSGEQRLSGLMPWQSCYSEFYFAKKLWPDFSRRDFLGAIREYSRRKRRFGK
ncbi:Tritrans,polycis-undecaprenyl-diphosphate synthase (GGDP specific) [Candidatus Bilamarchaeum dharawalense]|uniref:Tritrans,polycis-undecaprenyl-diphosphate synthase (geranylgeranyl-diphosphate specific) n=1 Tax=Candidatus Bilamarchaeum dharawalense TaxID=2885759 RepID=A0A5E4LXI0_9ARCH|nr:Tritrans,polycis-undecaprenyl-diphosphate synthase (GGDP specific) [Candidatus Bilamarchaeum dharawalense]